MNEPAAYSVAVRALCEFTAKVGSLDLRFTPSPTANEGIAGHATVTGRRSEHYEREVTLSGRYRQLLIKGRADGYDPRKNRLEEIKTFRGDLALIPENHRALHWAQAKIYGWLICQERELPHVELALVYFDVVKQKEKSLRESFTREALQSFFEQQCQKFLQWAERELAHQAARDTALETLVFPYDTFRYGQRTLAEAVYRGASTGRCVLVEAPTGIGKTLGTLFPLLKAMPRQALHKIFFLTAKTPGRQLALDALQRLQAAPVRTLELIAREKSCEHPDKACHGDSCPLAQGFYDRLPDARRTAAAETMLDQACLREIALAHQICPYYLSQEMARWSDVIVADYNYYFDQSAMLYGLTRNNQWRVALLVDEAHNLVDRARAMYSAELKQQQFREVKRDAPPMLTRSFNRFSRVWNALHRTTKGEAEQNLEQQPLYRVVAQLPSQFLDALQAVIAALTDYFTEQPFAIDSKLTRFYFDALHFQRVAEVFDDDTYLADCTWRKKTSSELNLRNLIPAALLRERFAAARSATLFSATLRPSVYYRDLLGLPKNTVEVQVPSPFVAEQLQIVVAAHISTRFGDRAASVVPICKLMAKQYLAQPGNYLAFFSSYQYLQQVLERLRADYPELPVWTQDRHMNESARQAFLKKFDREGRGIAFAVLGGAFAEGIDLPGTRLIGAFIATLGLPQSNEINEQLKQRMDAVFSDGYNYTYLYPGLRKVVQAAGRVIRTEDDKGVIHLIDDRFQQLRVRALLPSWWQVGKDL